ncbi:MAG: trypsin-like peptidase domain-containing protein [Phycisphaeraceae bacterium]|nr:trypsin-like peptidase domain-containing protein [Phycisphaeraceae bacterium]
MTGETSRRFVQTARLFGVLVASVAILLGSCTADAPLGDSSVAASGSVHGSVKSSGTRPVVSSAPTAASAQAVDAPADAVERLPTYLVISPWGRSGTALRVTDTLFLTARHVLPRRGEWIEIGRDGKRFRFERVAQGEQEGVVGDWALIRVPDAPSSLGALTDHPVLSGSFVRPGREVFLSGYWQGPGRWTRMSRMRSVPITTVAGPTLEMADSEKFPRRHLLFVEVAPTSGAQEVVREADRARERTVDVADVYSGMSGGPAVVWDSREARAVVVGVYVGGGEYERVFVPAGAGASGRAQIVRRIPAEVMDAIKAETAAAIK